MNTGRDFFDWRAAAGWAAGAAAAGAAALLFLFGAAFFASDRPAELSRALSPAASAPAEELTATLTAEPTEAPEPEETAPADPESVYASVLRLHILANSDGDFDQALKLEVRDAVLALTGGLLSDCPDRDTAAVIVEANEDTILRAVRQTLAEGGADYGAELVIGVEEYPERDYGGEVYPAGEYLSVRILLGAGEGHNWWCVLFPRLCLAPALPEPTAPAETTASSSAALEAGLSPEEYRAITDTRDAPKYRVKFRLWELLRGLFED